MKNGDKVSEKNLGGRPPKFENTKEGVNKFSLKIQEYFDACDMSYRYSGVEGNLKKVYTPRPYTLSGLAEALDMDLETLRNYSKKNKFFGTVEKAKRQVHRFQEEKLFNKDSSGGAQFALKNNFSRVWRDKTEVEKTGTPDVAVVNIVNYADIKDEDITT